MSTSGPLRLLGLMTGMHPLLPTSCEVCSPGRLASASLSRCSFQPRDVTQPDVSKPEPLHPSHSAASCSFIYSFTQHMFI